MGSLEQTDAESRAVQKTDNRVTLDSLKGKIVEEEYIHPECLPVLTICVLKVQNGFTVVGKSAPADPDNFDPELGRKFAYEDAVRQLWPLEGYALREQLAGE